MNSAKLYCQATCLACQGITRLLGEAGVPIEVHDVTTEPAAFDDVIALGYRSLPVIVGPEGISAVGSGATALARHLAQNYAWLESHHHQLQNAKEITR